MAAIHSFSHRQPFSEIDGHIGALLMLELILEAIDITFLTLHLTIHEPSHHYAPRACSSNSAIFDAFIHSASFCRAQAFFVLILSYYINAAARLLPRPAEMDITY